MSRTTHWNRAGLPVQILLSLVLFAGVSGTLFGQPTNPLDRAFRDDHKCPESVAHFQLVNWYPTSCWLQEPPAASTLEPELAAYEGAWKIQVTTDDGTSTWFAALSRGYQGASQRSPDQNWTLIGQFRTYPAAPQLVGPSGIRTMFFDGDAEDAMRVSPAGSPGMLRGQWTRGDRTYPVVWQKLPAPKIRMVQFDSGWNDANGQRVLHAMEVLDDGSVLTPGRLERHHPVSCGYGHMRGNCARVGVTIYGENLAQPIPVWLDPASHMELLGSQFVYAPEKGSFPTADGMKWTVTGEPPVAAIHLSFALWDGATPGPETLWFGDQKLPFDFVIHGYPTIRPVDIWNKNSGVVHSFSENGPYEATVFAPEEGNDEGIPYQITLWVPSRTGSGTLTSGSNDVIKVLGESLDGSHADSQGVIVRSFLAKQAGEAELTMNWTTADGSTYSSNIKISVSPVDLRLEAVPDYAEVDVGGMLKVGRLIRARLLAPADRRVGLAVTQGPDKVRIWRDIHKRRPVELERTGSGTRRVTWDPGKAPPYVYIEGFERSTRMRDIELVLSAASGLFSLHPFSVVGVDRAVLTVMDVRLVLDDREDRDHSRPYPIGQNSDDDDGDIQKDLAAIEIPVLQEDDLVRMKVQVRPMLPRTFGEVSLTAGRDLSVWSNAEKGAGNGLINDLDRSSPITVALAPEDLNRTLYLEGISASGSAAQLEIEVRPSYLVRGARVAVGEPLSDRQDTIVVQADVDIHGILDDNYDEEFDIGGSVPVIGDNELETSQPTRLDLRLTPHELPTGEARIEVVSGASKIRLLRRQSSGQYLPIELEVDKDGVASMTNTRLDQVPNEIYVQGLEPSEDREVEVAFSYVQYLDDGTTREVSRDRVRLTVRASELTLSPILITGLANDAAATKTVQLSARFGVTEEDAGLDVTGHPNTEYQWVGMGLPSYLVDRVINRLRGALQASSLETDFGLGLAKVEVDDQGVLTLSSPGVQLVRATHQGVQSNYALVLAGFKLKSITLVPGPPDYPGVPDLVEASTLAQALSGAVSSPEDAWLVVASDETGFWWDKGQIKLDEVTLEFLDGGPTISFTDLVNAIAPVFEGVGTAVLAPYLGPAAPLASKAILKGMVSDLKQIANEFVDYRSSHPEVAREWLVPADANRALPLFGGIIKGYHPGFADITGTLDLGDLGRASDKVTTWVLPLLEQVEIVTDRDQGNHAKPILLDQTLPDGGSRRIWARARGRLADLAPLPYTAAIASGIPEAWRKTGVDLPIEAFGYRFHVRGDLETQQHGDSEQYFVRDADLVFDVPNIVMGDDDWTVSEPVLADITDVHPTSHLFHKELTARDDVPDGVTEIAVRVENPVFGNVATTRGLAVRAAPKDCEVGDAIIRMDSEELGALDLRFKGDPYRRAHARVSPDDWAAARQRTRLGHFPVSSRVLPVGGPYSAGWLYAIEFPVNDAGLCGLDELISSLSSPEGAPAKHFSSTIEASYADPEGRFKDALIFFALRGWNQQATTGTLVDKVVQRVSVFDRSDHHYLYTTLTDFQMEVDASGEHPGFGKQVVGASAGTVGERFDHKTPLDAESRFQGIPPPAGLP